MTKTTKHGSGGASPTLNVFDNHTETRATVLIVTDQDFDTIWGGADGIMSFTTSNYSELAGWEKPVYPTIGHPPSETSRLQYGVRLENQVRRLTPLECERLQGFPDNWTALRADGSEQADSHRYKQMGNAVAVPVVEWVIRGIIDLETEGEQ